MRLVSAASMRTPQAFSIARQRPTIHQCTMRALLVLLCTAGVLALAAAQGWADDTHDYLFQFSEVSASAPMPGPLIGNNAMTVDSGHVWIAEHVEGSGSFRVDEFNAATGAFESQLAHSTGYYTPEYLGVAVAHPTGAPEPEVYLAEYLYEQSLPAVGVYTESGTKLASWTGAGTPTKSFGGVVEGMAVDGSGSPLDWAAGDLYVAVAGSQHVVDVFEPAPNGEEKYVTQLTGTCAALGPCAGEIPFTSPTRVAVDSANGEVLVIDAGNVDLFKPGSLPGQYEFLGTIAPPSAISFSPASVNASDGEGDIYVVGEVRENGESQGKQVLEFDAAGAYVGRLSPATVPGGSFAGNGPVSVAGDPADHDVFVGSGGGEPSSPVYAFGPNVVLPDVTSGPASGVAAEGAVLNGTVNPDDAGEATCRFAWGTSPSLGREAPCPQAIANGGSPVPIHVPLSELQPDTTYYYRLRASNGNGPNVGEPWQTRQFTTPGPGLQSESVTDVAVTSATIQATVDPHGAPTSDYFQYGLSADYGNATEVPAPPGAPLGSRDGDVQVAPQHVQGLTASTTYHYRVVVLSELSVEVAPGQFENRLETFYGPDQTFTTQSGSSSFALPDGRQWEMVTPPDKHGAKILPLGGLGHVTQAAASGDAIAFATNAPTESNPAGNAFYMQVLAGRGPQGWVTRDIGIPYETSPGPSTVYGAGLEYKLFSEDLSLAVTQPPGGFDPLLSDEASEQTAYLRSDYLHDPAESCAESCYRPLVSGCPAAGSCRPSVQAHADVPPGTVFGEEGRCPEHYPLCGPQFVGATPDLSHIVLRSATALTETPLATEGPYTPESLYEWSAGHLQLVSLLPRNEKEEEKPAPSPVLGKGEQDVRNAISADGSRVVFSTTFPVQHLYLRDVLGGETVQLDAPQGGAGVESEADPRFQLASSDGSRVFFIDDEPLVAGAVRENNNLYVCEMFVREGKSQCDLTDLTPGATASGYVIGASEDGSWVYFVAQGALAPGAVGGSCHEEEVAACDLYVAHYAGTGWETRFIAALSWNESADWSGELGGVREITARVAPDGRWLAFMSRLPLTGYDSHDALTGQPDAEVYLYDADTGRLACASCNPTGARPVGIEAHELLPGIEGGPNTYPWEGRLAASLPTWVEMLNDGAPIYQSRYLSNNGRLFFNSYDALVPQDVNGVGDVYEWEPPGVGGCTESSGGFDARSTGCVNLISSGSASEEAGLLDASATGGRDAEGHEGGGDVFFITTARLSSADYDSAADVYDAHECSSAAPCPPAAALTPPPCATGDACKPAPTPQPTIFGAPASSTFSGSGNVTPAGIPSARSSSTRAQRLARALRACRRQRSRRRSACKRRARRRYGAGAALRGATTVRRSGR